MERYPRVLSTTPIKSGSLNKSTQTNEINLCDDISNFFSSISTNIDKFLNQKPLSKSHSPILQNSQSHSPSTSPSSASAENLCQSIDKFFNDFPKNASEFLGNIDRVFNFKNQQNTSPSESR
jgi:hypothetical protein